jgi:hypothetical protein
MVQKKEMKVIGNTLNKIILEKVFAPICANVWQKDNNGVWQLFAKKVNH